MKLIDCFILFVMRRLQWLKVSVIDLGYVVSEFVIKAPPDAILSYKLKPNMSS